MCAPPDSLCDTPDCSRSAPDPLWRSPYCSFHTPDAFRESRIAWGMSHIRCGHGRLFAGYAGDSVRLPTGHVRCPALFAGVAGIFAEYSTFNTEFPGFFRGRSNWKKKSRPAFLPDGINISFTWNYSDYCNYQISIIPITPEAHQPLAEILE